MQPYCGSNGVSVKQLRSAPPRPRPSRLPAPPLAWICCSCDRNRFLESGSASPRGAENESPCATSEICEHLCASNAAGGSTAHASGRHGHWPRLTNGACIAVCSRQGHMVAVNAHAGDDRGVQRMTQSKRQAPLRLRLRPQERASWRAAAPPELTARCRRHPGLTGRRSWSQTPASKMHRQLTWESDKPASSA